MLKESGSESVAFLNFQGMHRINCESSQVNSLVIISVRNMSQEMISTQMCVYFFLTEFCKTTNKIRHFSSRWGTPRPPGRARAPPEATESIFHRFWEVPGRAFESIWAHIGYPLGPFGVTFASRGLQKESKSQPQKTHKNTP